jgi:hypothetical protein
MFNPYTKLMGYLGGGSGGGQPKKAGSDPNTYGPGDYTYGPDQYGYGGPGQIAGGGQTRLDAMNLPYFQQDRDRLQGLLNGQSPYAGAEWGGLIGQLQQQASGQGP